MGSREGVIKVAAGRAGVSVDDYLDRIGKGLLYCWRCKDWHPEEEFGKDSSRGKGRASSCGKSRNAAYKQSYTPKPKPRPGRRFVAARDGDYKQARRRVNHLVDIGLLPDPNDLPCTDCGHAYDPSRPRRRHEYDHHHGYEAQHHECVEAVCTICHHDREERRRAAECQASSAATERPEPAHQLEDVTA